MNHTVHDVLNAGFNLEPLKCLHCGEVGEVVFNQQICDGLCQICGNWQLGDSNG